MGNGTGTIRNNERMNNDGWIDRVLRFVRLFVRSYKKSHRGVSLQEEKVQKSLFLRSR